MPKGLAFLFFHMSNISLIVGTCFNKNGVKYKQIPQMQKQYILINHAFYFWHLKILRGQYINPA
jgi:hypothetical protein